MCGGTASIVIVAQKRIRNGYGADGVIGVAAFPIKQLKIKLVGVIELKA